MSEKADFYTENERFKRLIEYYAHRLKDRNAEGDMWGFLWELLNSERNIPNDRYVAVCLRNYYIKKSNEKAKHSKNIPLTVDVEGTQKDLDIQLDLRCAILKLKPKDRDIVIKKYYCDQSFEEIAKKLGTTRQVQFERCKRAVIRLRDILQSGADNDFYA